MVTKENIKAWAHRLRQNVLAVWIASRNNSTPLTAKIVAALAAGYALSPIDLIPDFIPVIGYLDDLIIVPLGVALAIRLIPERLMVEFREQARGLANKPVSYTAAVMIVVVWLLVAGLIFLQL